MCEEVMRFAAYRATPTQPEGPNPPPISSGGASVKSSQVRSRSPWRHLAPQAETEGVRHYGNIARMQKKSGG